jgi:hypothetical protein
LRFIPATALLLLAFGWVIHCSFRQFKVDYYIHQFEKPSQFQWFCAGMTAVWGFWDW